MKANQDLLQRIINLLTKTTPQATMAASGLKAKLGDHPAIDAAIASLLQSRHINEVGITRQGIQEQHYWLSAMHSRMPRPGHVFTITNPQPPARRDTVSPKRAAPIKATKVKPSKEQAEKVDGRRAGTNRELAVAIVTNTPGITRKQLIAQLIAGGMDKQKATQTVANATSVGVFNTVNQPGQRPGYYLPGSSALQAAQSNTIQLPAWFSKFIQNVCELPDRTSPDDGPDLMIATAEELEECALHAMQAHMARGAQ